MVVIVGLRPENISISVVQGRIEAIYDRGLDSVVVTGSIGVPSNLAAGTAGGHGLGVPRMEEPAATSTTNMYTYSNIIKAMKLRVVLRAYNPSGRADIRCDNATIRVLDMPDWPFSFDNMTEVGKVNLTEGFSVQRQTYHILSKSVTVNDTSVLHYIEATYGEYDDGFTAMVQVNTTISTSMRTVPIIFYCWPVTVEDGSSYTSTEAVTCKTNKVIGNPLASDVVPTMISPNLGTIAQCGPAPAPAPTEGAGY
uniref:Uncharacterized protein n=1 Tax=Arundo donax TaxID=35708 RepID=A0A0A9F7N9_ARUDO